MKLPGYLGGQNVRISFEIFLRTPTSVYATLDERKKPANSKHAAFLRSRETFDFMPEQRCVPTRFAVTSTAGTVYFYHKD